MYLRAAAPGAPCQLRCDAIGDGQWKMEWPKEDGRGSDVS